MIASSKPPFAGEVRRVQLGELISPAKVERCGKRMLPILSITKDEGIVLQNEKFKKRVASADVSGYKIVPRGKLVQGIHIDEANFAIQNLVDFGVVSPAYKVWDVNGSLVMPEYLAAVLRSPRCITYYRKMLSGTVHRRGRMSNELFYRLDVPLPSLLKQGESLETLDRVDRYLGFAHRQLSLLDALVKSRFIETFGDPKLEPNKWNTKTLGEVCATRLGKMLDAKKQTGNCSYPYLANTNVQWFHFDLTGLRHMDFTDDDRIEFGLKNGDILVTEGGEIGRCAIWREELPNCFFQKAVHRVRCDSEVLLPEYFAWCFKMKADLGLFEPYVSRSTIAHLTGKKIRQVPIPLPPLALQQEFADFAERVAKSQVVVRQQIEKLQALYDSLSQEYFG